VGCGALRLGSLAIPFLDPGHYCGIDAYEPLLRTGKRLMTELGIEKPFATLVSSDLNFEEFNLKFDFAIAQSVFTHMSRAQIRQCVHNLRPVMEPGGVLLFTYTLLPADARRGLLYYGTTPMSVPVIVADDFLPGLAAQEEVRYEPAQHLSHPTQRCGLFRFS
jgi:cyclopropane fatty-acyl-phospholipid synthase-like methyltransferase